MMKKSSKVCVTCEERKVVLGSVDPKELGIIRDANSAVPQTQESEALGLGPRSLCLSKTSG
jgi:hypothetical protein